MKTFGQVTTSITETICEAFSDIGKAANSAGAEFEQGMGRIKSASSAVADKLGEVNKVLKPLYEANKTVKTLSETFKNLKTGVKFTRDVIEGVTAAKNGLALATDSSAAAKGAKYLTMQAIYAKKAITKTATEAWTKVVGALKNKKLLAKAAIYGKLAIKILIGAAIAFLIKRFVNLIRNNEELQEKLKKIWEKIREVIGTVIEIIKDIVETVFGAIQAFIDEHGETIKEIFSRIWAAIERIVETAIEIVREIIEKFVEIATVIWDQFGDTILDHFRIIWDTIEDVIDAALEIVRGIFETFIGIFTGDWERAWEGIKQIFSGIWDYITAIFTGIKNIGKNIIEGLWDGIKAMGSWLKDRIRDFFRDTILGPIRNLFRMNSPSMLFAEYGGNLIQGLVNGISDGESNVVSSICTMANEMMQGLVSGISDGESNVVSSICTMASEMMQGLVSGISNGESNVVSTICTIADEMFCGLGNKTEEAKEMFHKNFSQIQKTVIAILTSMSTKAQTIIRKMTSLIDMHLTTDGRTIGRNFFRALGEGLIDEQAALLSKALSVAAQIRAAFSQNNYSGFGAFTADISHGLFEDFSSTSGAVVNQYFYGVREQETAYQAYRAAQKVAWEGGA